MIEFFSRIGQFCAACLGIKPKFRDERVPDLHPNTPFPAGEITHDFPPITPAQALLLLCAWENYRKLPFGSADTWWLDDFFGKLCLVLDDMSRDPELRAVCQALDEKLQPEHELAVYYWRDVAAIKHKEQLVDSLPPYLLNRSGAAVASLLQSNNLAPDKFSDETRNKFTREVVAQVTRLVEKWRASGSVEVTIALQDRQIIAGHGIGLSFPC